MYWIILWLATFFFFLLFPICFSKERRSLWCRRFRERRWHVQAAEESPSDQGNNGYRFIMSKEMEDDIRKSFLTERLFKFSMNVGVDDIRSAARARTSTETSVVSTASSSGTLAENSTEAPGVVAENEDTNGHNGNSTSDMDDTSNGVDEYMGDSKTMIAVPLAGEEYDCEDTKLRQVGNGCAICLSAFDTDDRVAWSSNACCPHAFHHSCILDWFMASGSKALKRQRRHEARTGVVEFADNPAKRITSVPMLCPCCRQEFLRAAPDDDSDSELEKAQFNDASASAQEEETTGGHPSSSTEESPPITSAETTPPVVTGEEAV